MNTTRTAIGKHKRGHIFPILLNVRATENSFAGILQQLRTTDEFIIFLSRSLRVVEATQDSLRLMGVTAADCADGDVSLTKYVDAGAVEALVEAGAAPEGKRVRSKRLEVVWPRAVVWVWARGLSRWLRAVCCRAR